MDPEEERVLYLSRVGREKIFKYGTYNMTSQRAITQDHPFYAPRSDTPEPAPAGAQTQEAAPAADAPPPPPPPSDNPDELAKQIMSSNFKVGLSQEEVDALLNGM